jgi:hypothetical protein
LATASKWGSNPFNLGLLNWGFNLAARILDDEENPRYLVNRVRNGRASYVQNTAGSTVWLLAEGVFLTHGLPFPYGRSVEPP